MLVEIIVSFSWKVGSVGIMPKWVGGLGGIKCLALRCWVTGEGRLLEVLVERLCEKGGDGCVLG